MDVFCRREIKYLITARQRQALEAAFAGHMKRDSFAHSSIRNIYYDTPDFRLIRRSLEHPVYKEKIRLRCYGSGEGPVFLEMKKKFQGIVYKRRMALQRDQAEGFMAGRTGIPDTQIGRELTYFRDYYQNLRPQLFLRYERDSWLGVEDPSLRITIDGDIYYRMTDLHLDAGENDQPILEPGMFLMEVKLGLYVMIISQYLMHVII